MAILHYCQKWCSTNNSDKLSTGHQNTDSLQINNTICIAHYLLAYNCYANIFSIEFFSYYAVLNPDFDTLVITTVLKIFFFSYKENKLVFIQLHAKQTGKVTKLKLITMIHDTVLHQETRLQQLQPAGHTWITTHISKRKELLAFSTVPISPYLQLSHPVCSLQHCTIFINIKVIET